MTESASDTTSTHATPTPAAHGGGHGHHHGHPEPGDTRSGQEFWEGFYRERDRIWTGNPNPLLVRDAADLPPGTALDLGCGEGGDAIWLAERGWRVTAVDISATALGRAAAHAESRGVGERIEWAEHDLDQTFPDGLFDLVSAQFFHSPVARAAERVAVLRRAADAVAPGGILLIGSHQGWPSSVTEPPADVHFPTLDELIADLALPAAHWNVEAADEVESEFTRDGVTGTRVDSILRIRRVD